jgi:hypothetical protein
MSADVRQSMRVQGKVNTKDARGHYIVCERFWHLYSDGVVRWGVLHDDAAPFWGRREEAEKFLEDYREGRGPVKK